MADDLAVFILDIWCGAHCRPNQPGRDRINCLNCSTHFVSEHGKISWTATFDASRCAGCRSRFTSRRRTTSSAGTRRSRKSDRPSPRKGPRRASPSSMPRRKFPASTRTSSPTRKTSLSRTSTTGTRSANWRSITTSAILRTRSSARRTWALRA